MLNHVCSWWIHYYLWFFKSSRWYVQTFFNRVKRINTGKIEIIMCLHKRLCYFLLPFGPGDSLLNQHPCCTCVRVSIFRPEFYHSFLTRSHYNMCQTLYHKKGSFGLNKSVFKTFGKSIQTISWCYHNHQNWAQLFFFRLYIWISPIIDAGRIWQYFPLMGVIPLWKWRFLRLAQWCNSKYKSPYYLLTST